MHRNTDDIPIDRLLLAVDAIFDAMREMGWKALPTLPEDMLGAPEQPASFCEFTREEMLAASQFLRRMDLLPVAKDAPGA